MKLETAETLAAYLQDAKVVEYSGRGMFGKETWAVKTSGNVSAGDISVAWAEACRDDEDLNPAELRNLRQDSLGLGMVLF